MAVKYVVLWKCLIDLKLCIRWISFTLARSPVTSKQQKYQRRKPVPMSDAVIETRFSSLYSPFLSHYFSSIFPAA